MKYRDGVGNLMAITRGGEGSPQGRIGWNVSPITHQDRYSQTVRLQNISSQTQTHRQTDTQTRRRPDTDTDIQLALVVENC